MKDSIPEEGDLIRLNPKYVEHIKENGGYFREGLIPHHSDHVLQVTDIVNQFENAIRVEFTCQPCLTISYVCIRKKDGRATGESADIPCFILAEAPTPTYIQDPSLYCSCGGPSKQSWTLTESFHICTVCKKEKQ
jgi:hypothetical protein